ncbi:MAG: 4Fe-4S dicluster domain-containing protein [Candidatus Heimdallarchaeota archaeon]|nr:4Fe-4S dicluster domain-containing protein [Candidatus Heimdallarchaeota archaeon]
MLESNRHPNIEILSFSEVVEVDGYIGNFKVKVKRKARFVDETKCIGCGTCTYLCPTCHCFDMQDEATLDKGARIRVWDACMFPEYTMHTSGHNPRPARMHRVRNRFYHKYSYFPKNSDVIACTGCGRCIRYCPVNIDIIELMNRVSEMEL